MSSMDRRVAWVGTVLVLCFALLFVQMNNIQVRQAAALDANPLNKQVIPTESPFFEPRGSIVSADGIAVAYSVRRPDEYHYLRVYPLKTAEMFSDITGYYANAVAADPLGVEASYNAYLEQHQSPGGSLGALLDQHTETDNVYLTVSVKTQQAAMTAFKDATVNTTGGAIVAIDPQTGAILAMYGNPVYNPNRLAVHNPAAVNKLAAQLTSLPCAPANTAVSTTPLSPLCNFAIDEPQPPGSTMKVVTTSAVFDHDPLIETQRFRPESTYLFPQSNPPDHIQNYGGGDCPPSVGYLAQVLAYSCDTAFAQIGDELGYTSLAAEAHSFGFGQVPPIDIPGAVPSVFSPANAVGDSTAYEGYSAIGQYDDRATVLQMALIASAIADNGVVMAPHVVSRAVNTYGETEFTYHPRVWLKATSAKTAEQVRQLMTGVTQVPGATAQGLFASWYAGGGPVIAAKTGTAEPTSNTCGTYNWLIALGPAAKGQVPTVAVAAMIPVSQSECASGYFSPTGASIAGPILLPVLQAALAQQGT
jgi:peptidoglycan glycosyltransferase